MGAERTSTSGYERRYNAAPQTEAEVEFSEPLTTNMPDSPDHLSL